MKNFDRKTKGSGIAGIFLLALLCVGAVELIACSHFAPELYQRITAPVRNAIHTAVDTGKRAAAEVSAQASALWMALTAPEEDPEPALETQLAGASALIADLPISDPAVTELKAVDGKDILTGGIVEVEYFNQGDETWSEQPYGSDHIGGYGCGPTAMAMAVSSMAGVETDPVQMAQWAVEHGYWARKKGSYHSIVTGAAEAHGLTAESLVRPTVDEIQEALLSGKLLVALMGPGHFTTGNHFILLRGITLSGSILVADPNSEERSLMEWDAQLLLDELSTRANSGGPLWALSAPLP